MRNKITVFLLFSISIIRLSFASAPEVTISTQLDQDELQRIQEFQYTVRSYEQYKREFEQYKKQYVQDEIKRIQRLQEYNLYERSFIKGKFVTDFTTSRCFRANLSHNKVGEPVADYFCSKGHLSDGFKCYNVDAKGWLYGSPVKLELCHASYQLSGTSCYHADKAEQLYGKPVSPVFCE